MTVNDLTPRNQINITETITAIRRPFNNNYTTNISAGTLANTTLTANATTSATSLTVASITGFNDGDGITIILDTGGLHNTTVDGTPSGSTINIDDPMPSQASSGNRVELAITEVAQSRGGYDDVPARMDGIDQFPGAARLAAAIAAGDTSATLRTTPVSVLQGRVNQIALVDALTDEAEMAFIDNSGNVLPANGVFEYAHAADDIVLLMNLETQYSLSPFAAFPVSTSSRHAVLTTAGVDSRYISETTSNPSNATVSGTQGAKRTADDGWRLVEWNGSSWDDKWIIHDQADTNYYGWGARAVGGMGGEIIYVATIAELRNACDITQHSGARRRIVRFSNTDTDYTGGVIFDLGWGVSDYLSIDVPYLTLDASSAPDGGVAIIGEVRIEVNGGSHIFRHIRLRGERPSSGTDNRSGLVADRGNIIFDHCSVAWYNDDPIQVWQRDYVTVSNCIVYESLYDGGHPDGNHSMGILIGNGINFLTIYRCLMVHCFDRTPGWYGGYGDFINNVIFNSAFGFKCDISSGTYAYDAVPRVNHEHNAYYIGPDTSFSGFASSSALGSQGDLHLIGGSIYLGPNVSYRNRTPETNTDDSLVYINKPLTITKTRHSGPAMPIMPVRQRDPTNTTDYTDPFMTDGLIVSARQIPDTDFDDTNDRIIIRRASGVIPDGTPVKIYADGTATMPGGITEGDTYYLSTVGQSDPNYTLHTTRADAEAGTSDVDITSSGSGNMTIVFQDYVAGGISHTAGATLPMRDPIDETAVANCALGSVVTRGSLTFADIYGEGQRIDNPDPSGTGGTVKGSDWLTRHPSGSVTRDGTYTWMPDYTALDPSSLPNSYRFDPTLL